MYSCGRFTRTQRHSIVAHPTVSGFGHPAKTDDPQASLRAELMGQLVAAQFEIEAAMTEIAGNAAALSDSKAQLQLLSALQRQIGTANPAALAIMRGEVVAAVAVAQITVNIGRATALAETLAIGLPAIANAARSQVANVIRDLHQFDQFLQFSSEQDAEDYRRRQNERLADIEQQLALRTPQGTLNASGIAVGQLADAYAHGAGNSPEFREKWDALVASTAKLRDAAAASGISTEEFDRNLREDLRRILKSKGLSEAQIDAHFAANPNPLEAARAFVDTNDVMTINAQVMENGQDNLSPHQQIMPVAPAPSTLATDPMAAAMAKLSAAGVVANALESGSNPAHGLNAQPATAASNSRSV